jgi:two-component system, LytTR family, sensor kinase
MTLEKLIDKKYTGLYFKMTQKDWYSFLYSGPFVVFLYNYLGFGEIYFSSVGVFLILTSITLLQAFLTHYLLAHICFFWRRRFPEIHHSIKRYTISILSYILFNFCIISFFVFLYSKYNFYGFEFSYSFFFSAFGILTVLNIVMGSVYEFFYTLQKWKDGIEQKEQLDKLKLQSELDVLKSQVNPHFLFNSLNSLSSLISEDPQQAELFVDELSRVYRYLLRNNQESLSTLESEVAFIRSYFQLLQTRHGSAIKLNLQIDEKYKSYLIPSITLQLLVENAVKHNAISKNKPLTIEIFTTDDQKLVVVNNKEQLKVKAPSNKVGLETIKSKYDLLNQTGFLIQNDDHNFKVELPLILEN